MAINFYNSPESSEWVTDATNTATVPISGELFTAGHVDRLVDEISAIQYALGVPGLRGSNGPVWGTNETITTGLATSSVTSVVFASDVSGVLTAGMLIAGAAPTTTGWRRITAVSTFTVTVNAAFGADLSSEYAVRHGTVTRRITAIESISNRYPPGHMYGLSIANNGTDPTNDIDIASGSARDSTDAVNMDLASAITKRLDAAWAVGTNQGMLDTGAVGNNTYHIWLIKRSDTGVVDVLASLSASSPTMPANYDYKRYLWPITRSGGSNVQFKQTGRRFQLVTSVLYSTGANPGTSRITAALTAIPTGISLIAIVRFGCRGADCLATCRPLTETDAAPSGTAAPYWDAAAYDIGGGLVSLNSEFEVVTDTSAQVAVRLNQSGSGQIAIALQKGWIVP